MTILTILGIIAIVYGIYQFVIENAKRNEEEKRIQESAKKESYELAERRKKWEREFGECTETFTAKYKYMKEEIRLYGYSKKFEMRGKIYNYSDLTRIRTDEQRPRDIYISSTNTGSIIKRAIVGGVVAGGIGAIVGATTAQKTTMLQSDLIIDPQITVELFLNNETECKYRILTSHEQIGQLIVFFQKIMEEAQTECSQQ